MRLAVIVTLMVFVLFMVVTSTVIFLNAGFGVWFSEAFVFLGFPYVVSRLSGRDPLRWTGVSPLHPKQVLFGFAVGAANFFALAIPLQFAAQLAFPKSWSDYFDSAQIFQDRTPVELGLIVSGVIIAAPFAEEFFFRGVLQNALLEAKVKPKYALLIAAVIFSGFHFDPVGFLARVELGLVFGFLFLRTRSIWPGMMAHAANNAITSVAYFVSGGETPENANAATSENLLQVGLWMIVGLIALAGLAHAAKRYQLLEPRPLTERALPAKSFWALAAPWLAVALVSLAVLVTFDKRGIQLTLIDARYPIPERVTVDEPDAVKELKQLRRRARSGEVPLDEYEEKRRELIGNEKTGPQVPTQTEPAPVRPTG